MTPKKKQVLTIGLLLFIVAAWIGVDFWRKYQLEKSHKVTIAKATGCSRGAVGNAGRLYLNYVLEVGGEKYKSSNAFSSNQISWDDCQKYFVGKAFPAVYNQDYPSISSMLITPKDFARFGKTFPDSLKWVLEYIK